MGRAPEVVNIPSKPTPEGFKIWVLANKGYILDFIQHAKGNRKGPVNLDKSFIEEGFSKTQAVVLNLLLQKDADTNERLYPPRKHVVWLNNLFTSVKLLTRLRGLGIGGAGTVRTTKTKRKEQGDLKGDIKVTTTRQGKKKVPAKQIKQTLAELKLTHAAQIPWGELYKELSKDGQVMEFAWKDTNIVLFISTVDDGKLNTSMMRLNI